MGTTARRGKPAGPFGLRTAAPRLDWHASAYHERGLPITDPEREHLRDYIAQLESSRGRWRLATLILAVVLVMPVVLGGLLGVAWLPRLELQRARALEAEMQAREAMEAERQARLQAEAARAAAEAEHQRADRDRREREKQNDKK